MVYTLSGRVGVVRVATAAEARAMLALGYSLISSDEVEEEDVDTSTSLEDYETTELLAFWEDLRDLGHNFGLYGEPSRTELLEAMEQV